MERIEIASVDTALKNKLALVAKMQGVSISEYVKTLLDEKLDNDLLENIQHENRLDEPEQQQEIKVPDYRVNAPTFISEKESKLNEWVKEQCDKITKDNPKYLTVNNINIAEWLCKSYGYKTISVKSAKFPEPKKWLLVKTGSDSDETKIPETENQ